MPTPAERPTAIGLFSGAGGLDLGVAQAGFRTVASVELDEHACASLALNAAVHSPEAVVVRDDVTSLDPVAFAAAGGLQAGEVDLLFGGPPCQSFSQIGQQGSLGDKRGPLLFQMARFAEALRPRAVVIEQVRGLLKARGPLGDAGGVMRQLRHRFSQLGYSFSFQVLNAAHFGVPQARERIFIVCLLGDRQFQFPDPTHAPSLTTAGRPLPESDLPATPTVGHALAGLGRPTEGKGHTERRDSHVDVTPIGDRRRIQGVPEGKWLSSQLHLPIEQRGRLTRKDTTKYRRLNREGVSLTLRCGEIFFHPTEHRYLTPRECMRLHGYPDSFQLVGPIRGRSGTARSLDQHRQIANSVPPPLAKVVAMEVLQELEATTHIAGRRCA